MLFGWKKPAVAIVLSGEQHGYMEPCGCSATQSGGLSRRADFFRQVTEKGWNCLALDLGGLVRKDNLQNKLKFQVMLSALGDLGYKALALGTEELGFERLEPGILLALAPQKKADGSTLSFVNANVEFLLFKGSGTSPALPTKVITIDGHRIGVTAIFGKSYQSNLLGNAPDGQINVQDPQAALPAAIAALKKEKSELLILLSHAKKDESIALAKKFPEFQIVVTADGPEDGHDTPERIGKTLLLEVGQKGKHIGVVGYYPEDRGNPLHFELIDLDKERFHDTPKMIDRMREYQHMLDASYDAIMQDLPKAPHPSGDRFAGVETCKNCHTKAYAVWKDSKHAEAYESLITGREGAKNVVPRNRDPECLACHTTGWEPQQVFPYESGFYSMQRTPQLKGQQCENCHGPASKHNQLETAWKKDPQSVKKADLTAERERIKVTLAFAEKTLCYRCHDLDNDPHFKFAEYWDQIKHPGRD